METLPPPGPRLILASVLPGPSSATTSSMSTTTVPNTQLPTANATLSTQPSTVTPTAETQNTQPSTATPLLSIQASTSPPLWVSALFLLKLYILRVRGRGVQYAVYVFCGNGFLAIL